MCRKLVGSVFRAEGITYCTLRLQTIRDLSVEGARKVHSHVLPSLTSFPFFLDVNEQLTFLNGGFLNRESNRVSFAGIPPAPAFAN